MPGRTFFSSRNAFRLPGQRIFWGRLHVYDDHIVFRGWTWRARFERVVPLAEIRAVDWWTGQSPNFAVHLRNGRSFACDLTAAGWWALRLEGQLKALGYLDRSLVGDAPIPDADPKRPHAA